MDKFEKIAIISDIHGNLEALETVLKDVERQGIEKIYCIGDIIAKGVHQNECVELVKKKCQVVIQGNCDNYFANYIDIESKPELEQKRIIWNRSKISDENMKYLANLPYCYEFYMSGKLVRLLHAHPIKNSMFVGNIDSFERYYELVLPSENTVSNEKTDVLICGHIHTPYVQKIYNRTIINTGAVGNALDVFRNEEKDGDVKNTTVANYLIISGILDSKDDRKISYELVSVPYDIEKELMCNADNVEYEAYKNELTKGNYRDMSIIDESFRRRGIDPDKI